MSDDIVVLNGASYRRLEIHKFAASEDVRTVSDMTLVVDDRYDIETKLVRIASFDETIDIYNYEGQTIEDREQWMNENRAKLLDEERFNSDYTRIDLVFDKSQLRKEYRALIDMRSRGVL